MGTTESGKPLRTFCMALQHTNTVIDTRKHHRLRLNALLRTIQVKGRLPLWDDGLEILLRVSRSASRGYTHYDGCNRNHNASPLDPFRVVIMSVGEEKSAKLDNNKLFEHERRANGTPFVT